MIYVMGNTFGSLFKISTWGESHGGGVGVVIDGCPSLLPLTEADIQRDLDRRRPGQSRITTQRDESDKAEILSGVFEGKTIGAPIAILVRNEDAKPAAYEHLKILTDLHMPISLMKLNTGSVTGRAVAALAHAKR